METIATYISYRLGGHGKFSSIANRIKRKIRRTSGTTTICGDVFFVCKKMLRE